MDIRFLHQIFNDFDRCEEAIQTNADVQELYYELVGKYSKTLPGFPDIQSNALYLKMHPEAYRQNIVMIKGCLETNMKAAKVMQNDQRTQNCQNHSGSTRHPSIKKKYQVFVSSTYKDLVDERMAVVQCLLDNDCIPIGMEQFPASEMSQIEYIEKALADCDYYLLILAGRYGSLDSNGVGYTEKEYQFAIDHKIPVMSFVFHDLGKLPQEKSATSDKEKEMLHAFRERVCSDRLVKFYDNVGNLKAAVATAINKCIKDFPAVGWVRDYKCQDSMIEESKTPKNEHVSEERIKEALQEKDSVQFYITKQGKYSFRVLSKTKEVLYSAGGFDSEIDCRAALLNLLVAHH